MLLAILVVCQAQSQSLLFKTRATHAFYAKNPNIGIEIPIAKHWSITGECLYRRQVFLIDAFGGYTNMGARLHAASGYKAMVGIRNYLGREHVAPFGWYFGLNHGWNYIRTGPFMESESRGVIPPTYVFEATWRDWTVNFGTQFSLFKVFSVDLFLGVTKFPFFKGVQTTVASDSAKWIGSQLPFGMGTKYLPDVGCKVGFHF